MSLIVQNPSAILEYNPAQIDLIKRTIAKNATNDELEMFLYLAKAYKLDPFKKEIFFTKYQKKNGDWVVSNITARDGYLKIAQDHPDYEGLISFVVKEGDIFEIDASHYEITHKFGIKRGRIVGAWAKCDRKGKRPQICFVEFDEYKQDKDVWNKFPSAMIQKVAEVFVLRRQFNISGLVAREEIDYQEAEYQSPSISSTPNIATKIQQTNEEMSDDEWDQLVNNAPPKNAVKEEKEVKTQIVRNKEAPPPDTKNIDIGGFLYKDASSSKTTFDEWFASLQDCEFKGQPAKHIELDPQLLTAELYARDGNVENAKTYKILNVKTNKFTFVPKWKANCPAQWDDHPYIEIPCDLMLAEKDKWEKILP